MATSLSIPLTMMILIFPFQGLIDDPVDGYFWIFGGNHEIYRSEINECEQSEQSFTVSSNLPTFQSPPPFMDDPPMKSTKLRVLCLHGFRTSGKIMKMQMRDVISTCDLFVDFVFLDAPHEAQGEPHEIVKKIWNPRDYSYFEWWNREDKTEEYVGVKKSMKYLESFMCSQGPFDGILGFSQGGAFAATLCASATTSNPPKFLSSLRFGLLFSAFVPRDETMSSIFKEALSCTDTKFPMWMTCGEKEEEFFHNAIGDKIDLSFPNVFGKKNSIVVLHPTGHEFPLRCRGGEVVLKNLETFLSTQR